MTACRSAGANELTRSAVVWLREGEGEESVGGLAEAEGLPGGITVGAGGCASALVADKRPIRTQEVNRYIRE